MDERVLGTSHKVSFANRQGGAITGVKDVISFDLQNILLETDYGMLTVKGHDLHVNRLSVDKGEIDISGTIDSIVYSDVAAYAKKNESFFAKMFK